MPIQGLRDTSGFVTDQRPKNWREGILLLYPNGKMVLTGLTSLMKSKSTDDPEYNWWEKSLTSQRLALTTTITSSSTTLSFSGGGAKAFRDGHLLRCEQHGEIVRVVGDASSDTALLVQRGWSGTTASSLNPSAAGINPNWHCIGSAFEEASQAPTGVSYDPTKRYNYTQIFRNTLEMSRTAQKTRLRTGDQVKEAKRETLELHGIEQEKAYIFGQRSETTIMGKPARTTGGIISFIHADNIVDRAGAATDLEDLEGYLKRMFDYGSSEKFATMGNTALLTIQRIIRKNTSWQIHTGIKEFGMNVARLVCPFGELVMKSHPLFNQLTGGTTGGSAYYGVDSWMLVLDMDEIIFRSMSGDDTRYEPKLETNGLDGMKSGWITEAGLEVHHPQSHFLIKGLATAAAD
jgi:hypothetical protein